jgi:hypothetical protein
MDFSQLLDPKYLPQNSSPNGLTFDNLVSFVNRFGDFVYRSIDPFAPSSEAGMIIKAVLSIFSIFFILMITYSIVRLFEIRKKEHEYLHHEIEEYAKRHAEEDKKASGSTTKNEQWETVLQYLYSTNPSEWKLSVIEADTMLDDLMTKLGFKGESLGEKLKSATQDNFHNFTSAWEAHTIRNRIAHEGSSFELSQHETKRVIAIYETIFRGYGFI